MAENEEASPGRDEESPQYVSREEAARLLGITAPQVSRLLIAGKLAGIPPQDWQVSLASVLAWKKPGHKGWPKGVPRKTAQQNTEQSSELAAQQSSHNSETDCVS